MPPLELSPCALFWGKVERADTAAVPGADLVPELRDNLRRAP